jgi:hypothetical protein
MDMNTSNDAPQTSKCSDQQLQVWRALRAKSRPDYPFHHWYAGALWALKSSDDDNPDRLAHAGNSLRELLEKLPRALGTAVIGPDANFLKQKREAAGAALFQVKDQFSNDWVGQTITDELAAVLEQFKEYIELSNRPSRKQRTVAGLEKLDPMMHALPQQLRQGKWQRYNSLSKQFEGFTHHHPSGTEGDFRTCVDQLEELVLDLMAPITADDQNKLLEIVSDAANITDEDIKEALRLIERRGANCAFFFENVHDPIWLQPLESAGYFKTPSQVELAGEGLVAFPIWWPMQFLKRVTRDAPGEVLRILLQMDSTDNPQVLDGVVEIASELPIDLAVRLEPMISDYINKPFHV